MEMKYVPTTCPYCGTGCGLNLVVRDGKVVGVSPWHRNPINEGKLCIRGNSADEFINDTDHRVTTPLVKKGDKFEEASWEEAYKLIESKFKSYKGGEIGCVASSRVLNEDNYLMKKFASEVLKTQNIDCSGRFCNAGSESGLREMTGTGSMSNSIVDLASAKCILTISNPFEENPLIRRRLVIARKNGAKLISVSPVRHATAKESDLYLPCRPGTQVTLFNSILHEIIKNGWENKEFIAKRTKDFDKLKSHVMKDTNSPENAGKVCGVDPKSISSAAEAIAKSGATAFVGSVTIPLGYDAWEKFVKAFGNLALVTGSFGSPGTGLNMLRGQSNTQGAIDMGCVPSGKEGLTVPKMIEALAAGKGPKAMYIMGENIVMASGHPEATKKALETLDFLVVQDCFLTETAERAHVILPSAAFGEREGTQTNSDRHVQRSRKAVDAPGSAKPDWQIICDLAKAMGHEKEFAYKSAEEVFNEIAKTVDHYRNLSYAVLEKPESAQWPLTDPKTFGSAILFGEKFDTESGKGSFYQVDQEPVASDNGYPFVLLAQWHQGTLSAHSKSVVAEYPGPAVRINSEDAREIGIKNNSMVRVVSKDGQAELPAIVTPDILKGVVAMPSYFPAVNVKIEKIQEAD
ncbi:MAG TPA: molybdopterin-dependent oxidoreductase [Methanoregulaceae archaeon]|nr:molybdopterin-dependent oxidoreductase [Methanoregulaceae archaeon]